MSFNLDSLFIEWRSKVPTGVPNPKNDYHLVLLKEVCLNRGIDIKIVDNVILALEQDDKGGSLDDKEKEKAKKLGLVSKGLEKIASLVNLVLLLKPLINAKGQKININFIELN